LGVLRGSDGKFRPNDPITRAELSAIINRIFIFPDVTKDLFADINGKWYEPDVNALALQGIYIETTGAANAEKALTREEAVEMLNRAFLPGYSLSPGSPSAIFTDQADISPEYRAAVINFQNLGFISGYANGSFQPKGEFTRAQVVTILNNIIGMYITEPGEYDVTDGANVCIAVPGVTLNGANIHYIMLLPATADGVTKLEYMPEVGIVWGNHVDRDQETLIITNWVSKKQAMWYQKTHSGIDALFAGGSGRACDPYQIADEIQLRHLNDYLSNDFREYYFSINNDIPLSSEWIPIGYKTDWTTIRGMASFEGALDGNGHSIRNLDIRYKGNSIRYFGLFRLLGGTVKNLNISGYINIELVASNESDSSSPINVGSFAGDVTSRSIIDNCNADVAMNVTGPYAILAGGIVGRSISTVSNCSASGSIAASSSATEGQWNARAGGIAGMVYGGAIQHCYSDANVTAIGGYYSFAGGICGACGVNAADGLVSTVDQCFSSGTIRARDSSMQNNAGGIAGQEQGNNSMIRECGASADVSASGDPGYFNAVGGLVGSAYLGCGITDSYSAGTADADGLASIGGLVGRAECVINNSYTLTKIGATRPLNDFSVNGLTGTIRNYIQTHACGVFNVAEPHFITYGDATGKVDITYVGDRSLNDLSTYTELGDTSWSDQIWMASVSAKYPYLILRNIPENWQINGL